MKSSAHRSSHWGQCGWLSPGPPGHSWGHWRYRSWVRGHVGKRRGERHGGVYQHTPLKEETESGREREEILAAGSKTHLCKQTVMCASAGAATHLEVIHVLILQGAGWWRCCRQRLLMRLWMMPHISTPKTHCEFRLVDRGQVTASQKPMANVTKLDINGHWGRTAEMWTTGTPQFLQRD